MVATLQPRPLQPRSHGSGLPGPRSREHRQLGFPDRSDLVAADLVTPDLVTSDLVTAEPSSHDAPLAPWNRPEFRRPVRSTGTAHPRSGRRSDLRSVRSSDRPSDRPSDRRVNRLRSVLAGVFLALVVALAFVGGIAALGADAAASGPASTATPSEPSGVGSSVPTPVSVTVRPGDTLWSIARRLQPSGDLRVLVDALADRIDGSVITAGQRIDVTGLVD